MNCDNTPEQNPKKRPGRWKKGESGNPHGRPKGRSEVTVYREQIRKDLPAIITVLVKKALEGDTQAARVLVDRCVPVLRFADIPNHFEIQGTTLVEQGQSIVTAVAQGELTAEQGSQLMSSLSGLGRLIEIEEFRTRLDALENRK